MNSKGVLLLFSERKGNHHAGIIYPIKLPKIRIPSVSMIAKELNPSFRLSIKYEHLHKGDADHRFKLSQGKVRHFCHFAVIGKGYTLVLAVSEEGCSLKVVIIDDEKAMHLIMKRMLACSLR